VTSKKKNKFYRGEGLAHRNKREDDQKRSAARRKGDVMPRPRRQKKKGEGRNIGFLHPYQTRQESASASMSERGGGAGEKGVPGRKTARFVGSRGIEEEIKAGHLQKEKPRK